MLRKAGDAMSDATRAVTLSDLFGVEMRPQQEMTFATIKVHRPGKDKSSREDYSVPMEQSGAVATAARR